MVRLFIISLYTSLVQKQPKWTVYEWQLRIEAATVFTTTLKRKFQGFKTIRNRIVREELNTFTNFLTRYFPPIEY